MVYMTRLRLDKSHNLHTHHFSSHSTSSLLVATPYRVRMARM